MGNTCDACNQVMTCVIGNFYLCKNDECGQERSTVPDLDPKEWDGPVTTKEITIPAFNISDVDVWPGFTTFSGVWTWEDEADIVFGAATGQQRESPYSLFGSSSPKKER